MKEKKKSPTGGQTSGTADTLVSNDSTPIIEESTQNVKAEPKAKDTKKDIKSRFWWGLIYPESAPPNWRELVQETLLEAFVSPIHDSDINPNGVGEYKKEHYHVILCWPGPTTYTRAKETRESFGGVIQPKHIASLRGAVRYLCHLDNPEKAIYSQDDVVCYNGADYYTVINLVSDKYITIEEMQDFVDRYQITSFVVLNNYARKHRKADWFRALCDSAGYIMREYCKSSEYALANNIDTSIETLEKHIAQVDAMENVKVDSSTGEIIEKLVDACVD